MIKLKPIPEPCADFGLEPAALAQLKAATTTTGSSNIAKKIRVYNTAVKRSSSPSPFANTNEGSNGFHHGSDGRGNQSDSSRGASPPSTSIFDDNDEQSIPAKLTERSRKRKVATEADSSEEDEDYAFEKKAKKPKSNGESGAHHARKWHTPIERKDLDTSTSHIQSIVDKHRALKRIADQALQQTPPDFSALDHYLTASLGFFEAAALHELSASQNEGTQAANVSRRSAIELYRGLAPSGDTPTLLTYYVGRCEQAKCKLRIILGQRCLAMAYARIFCLQRKGLFSSVRTLLKANGDGKTIELDTSKLLELNDGLRFGETYAQSETSARSHQHIFTPFPSHPLDIDPFEFLKFIRDEHKQVEAAEPFPNGSSASSPTSPPSKNDSSYSSSANKKNRSSDSKKSSQGSKSSR